jgi:hypothetical protein
VEELERLLTEYEQGMLTKREYCEQQGIPLSTFDYHWQRRRKKQQQQQQNTASGQQLVKVELASEHPNRDEKKGFTLLLAKDRRIEVNWSYPEQDLVRLIRILEAV